MGLSDWISSLGEFLSPQHSNDLPHKGQPKVIEGKIEKPTVSDIAMYNFNHAPSEAENSNASIELKGIGRNGSAAGIPIVGTEASENEKNTKSLSGSISKRQFGIISEFFFLVKRINHFLTGNCA